MEKCAGNLESILLKVHILESTTTTLATNSFAFRATSDTIHLYLSLLYHISGVHMTYGWVTYKTKLNIHATQLISICYNYRHCLQCVLQIYIYLRDDHKKNWVSSKIQKTELQTIRSKMEKQQQKNGDGSIGSQPYSCSHYKSALHRNGRASFP